MQTRISIPWFVINVIATLGLMIGTTSAQQATSMPDMNMGQSTKANSASVQAFKGADQRMMRRMQGQTYTGDADKDFVSHMIPHP